MHLALPMNHESLTQKLKRMNREHESRRNSATVREPYLLQVQNHTLQRRRGQVRQEVNQRWRGDVDFVLSSRARFRDRGANSSVLLDPPCDVAHQQLRYLIRRAPSQTK